MKKKTSNKKKASQPAKKRKRAKKARVSLQPLREQLQVLVDQANERVRDLASAGLSSRALDEAIRTIKRKPTRVDDETLFRADLKRRRDINVEFARVHSFLNDYTSTIMGAHNFESDISRLTGQFGAKWNTTGLGQNYNTEIISEEVASKSFEIYRKVIEAAGGWERAVGMLKGKESLIGYGSENLIIAIYDMVENDVNEGDIIKIALEQINSGIEAYSRMSERQRSNYDYGIVFDDETDIERRNYFSYKFDRRRGI